MFENFSLLAQGFALAISPYNIVLMMVGVFLGILVGVLPGLGATNGVTLLMPLTFGMNPVSAIILLTSMYWGALYAGSTTSILFNIPGEPSSVATTFDGHPMAEAGRASEALTALPAGIGLATLRSILKLWLFVPEAYRGVYSAGNGPAMRSAILGICFADDEPRMRQLVRLSTRLTHVDPKAECGALAIALAARCSMRGGTFEEFSRDLERLCAEHGAAAAELVSLVARVGESVRAGQPTKDYLSRQSAAQTASRATCITVSRPYCTHGSRTPGISRLP